ncbi:MAG: hypothetical protein ACP5OB_07590 [Candidatus Ratteibacteria bacterium]
MVINDIILKRLGRLEESLRRLENKKNINIEEFKNNLMILESLLDI